MFCGLSIKMKGPGDLRQVLDFTVRGKRGLNVYVQPIYRPNKNMMRQVK